VAGHAGWRSASAPALRDLGIPILDVGDLDASQRAFLARYFLDSVEPIRTRWPRTPHIRSLSSATDAKGRKDSFYAVDYAARTASELGADMVKVNFPHPEKRSRIAAGPGS
jgi:hypothetical protein